VIALLRHLDSPPGPRDAITLLLHGGLLILCMALWIVGGWA
jgi:hypothetical protein